MPGSSLRRDGRRMRPRKKVHARRCSECGEWFSPDPRAAKTQETCSKACRLLRRGRQAKERREDDIEGFRAAELTRQRRCRAAKRAAGGPGPPDVVRLPDAVREEIEAVVALALGGQPSRATLVVALLKLTSSAVKAQAG